MIAAFLAMPNWLATVLSIALAILVLVVMITIHELGHYTAGRILKFKINEFSIGFGYPLFKKVGKSGQIFSIRMIPLGGYCAFAGEDEEITTEGAFNKQAPWKRLIVLFSGAFANFIFAILVVIISFLSFGQFLDKVDKVHDVKASDSAYVFQEGDLIVTLNNRDIYIQDDLVAALKGAYEGELISATVIREGQREQVKVLYRSYEWEGETYSGLGISLKVSNYKFPFWENLSRSFVYTFKMFVSTLLIPGKLITGMVGIEDLGGPITTIGMTAQLARMGFHYLLEVIAMIGISLAVFNLFPVPALDGSRMVFTTLEWIRKKPINRKVEAAIHAIGLMLLFGMVILVDLLHFI